MWPSEAMASRVYDIANIMLILALIFGALATVLVVWMGNVKEGYLRRSLSETSERAAVLERNASALMAEAEAAKLEQARLKSLVVWRSIPGPAGDTLVNVLSTHSGSVTLAYVQVDPEAVGYTAQISKAFDLAKSSSKHWRVEIAPRIYSSRVVTGLHIPDRKNAASDAVRKAFTDAHIPFDSQDIPDTGFHIGPMATGAVPVTTEALIIVGSRDAPF